MPITARGRFLLLGLLALTLALGYWLTQQRSLETSGSRALAERPAEALPQQPLTAPQASDADARSIVARVETAAPAAPEAKVEPSAPTPPAEFLVQVVDHEDRPLRDLDVAVTFHYRGGFLGDMKMSGATFRVPSDAPDALFRIPRGDVEKAFAQAQEVVSKATEKPSFEIAFECQRTAVEATRHVLANAEPPAETIRLKLAPAGRVRVEVRHSAGEHAQQPLLAMMRSIPATLPREEALRRVAEGKITHTAVQDGVALFPYVSLGQLLQIEISDRDGLLRTEKVVLEGPREPGSEVVAEVLLGQTNPVLAGRLVDAANVPIAQRHFDLAVVNANRSGRMTLLTDAEGSFERAWMDVFGSPETAEAIEFRWERGVPTPGEVHIARILCPPIPATGRVELGTIVLRVPSGSSQALLVSGRVVDGAGQPLPRAGLSFYAIWPLVRQGPWEEHAPLTGELPEQTDEQGRFVAYVRELPRGVRVDARLEGYYLQSSLLCEPGRENMELVMRRGAVLRGKLLLDPELRPDAITLRFSDTKRVQAQRSPDAEGNFELRALRPGSGTLHIGLGNWPAKAIEGISIPEDAAEVEDARCTSIDLRGAWRRWQLELDSGTPFTRRSSTSIFDAANPEHSTWFDFDASRQAELWIPVHVEEIDLLHYECLPLRLRYIAGKQVVKPEREPALFVELPPSFQIPEGYALELHVSAPRDAGLSSLERQRIAYDQGAFDARRRVEIRVPKSGTYLFHWYLRSKLDNRQELIAEVPEAIDLGGAAPTLSRTPPADALARSLAKWG
ncbi:MAG: hypothetical protein IPN34_18765 [Planctomycetes bacterium]|nr:hypothetical protein [Planctomycetota bacterium]